MIVATDAIVLRSMKYGETSKIVTVYSRKYGKMKVIAKGARSSRSKFGAALEPMTHASLIVYRKEHRELHLLSKAEIVSPLLHLNSEGEKLATGLAIVELVNMVMHDEEENASIYALLSESLEVVNSATRHPLNVFLAFELRLCALFGYNLDLGRCASCGKEIEAGEGGEPASLQLATGSLLCADCRRRLNSGGVRVSNGVLRSLRYLQSAPLPTVPTLALGREVQHEIVSLLSAYVQYHIEGVRTLKSLSLFTHT